MKDNEVFVHIPPPLLLKKDLTFSISADGEVKKPAKTVMTSEYITCGIKLVLQRIRMFVVI